MAACNAHGESEAEESEHDEGGEEDEMGHAFGLEHVCAPGATVKTPTNIMASADCKKGSGGLRNIGFDSEQAGTVRQYAQLIHQKLQVKNQSK